MLRVGVVVTVITALVAGVAGCAVVDGQRDIEFRVNEMFSIKDHDLIERKWEQGTVARYIGSWTEDVTALIVAPSDVNFKPVEHPNVIRKTQDIASAYFRDESSGQHCGVTVRRLSRSEEPYSHWDLTSRQRTDLVAGTAELVEIVSVCERSG